MAGINRHSDHSTLDELSQQWFHRLLAATCSVQHDHDGTWAIIYLAPQPQAGTVADLYGADPARLLQIIRMASATDPRQLMLVGHNPGMHELALALAGSGDANGRRALADNLPTSGLVVFDFAINDWNDVGFRRGKLVLFLSPKLLRQASDE